ncbi:MAG TPA: radical SAM family heme chaperone HemW, partial [Bacteroidales bacterium]|nr:radical SAM family heme chaperone HemW [Bacteroidales bacterium]
MAGLYVHIPFCRQACRYCDFYFTVSLKYRDDLVKALVREIELRSDEFRNLRFETLYFGGGTPSVLTADELATITDAVFRNYQFGEQPEFTLEANPDDLKPDYLKNIRNLGINRLSMGVQSFHDRDLELMRRSHTAKQAEKAIKLAQDTGFENMSVDLIYGIPGTTTIDFEENLIKVFEFNIPHISAYHLTFEPGTVFDHWLKKGRLAPVDEDESFHQFSLLKKLTAEQDFLHYEISNF